MCFELLPTLLVWQNYTFWLESLLTFVGGIFYWDGIHMPVSIVYFIRCSLHSCLLKQERKKRESFAAWLFIVLWMRISSCLRLWSLVYSCFVWFQNRELSISLRVLLVSCPCLLRLSLDNLNVCYGKNTEDETRNKSSLCDEGHRRQPQDAL